MGAIKFIGVLTLITLFAFAIGTFAVKFAEDNSPDVSINDTEEAERLSGLSSYIVQTKSTGDNKLSVFTNSSIETDSDNIKTGSPFKIGTAGVYSGTVNATRTGFNQLFGGETGGVIFFTALIGMLSIMAVAYAWSLWKGGAP